MPSSVELRRAVCWRWLDGWGLEHCRLSGRRDGLALAGGIVAWSEGPWTIEYEIHCDAAWRTRSVALRATAGVEERRLAIEAHPQGAWIVDGEVRGDLQGCTDVDLGFTPSTNTLPIRRLAMKVGDQETIEAAWVQFPSLAVRRVPQRYTRLEAHTYRYDNLPTGFTADVTVDADGLVVSYPPGWERVIG